MPTTEEAAFLASIAAAPDDDTPRLAFADWLDEHGTPDDSVRAELIRTQCRAAALKPTSKERRELDRRAKEILNTNTTRWTKPLHDLALGTWEFRRGFVEHVTVGARLFKQNARKLVALAPTLRSAHFPNASNEVRELIRCPQLKQLTSIDIHSMCSCGGCAIQSEIVALFHSTNAVNLRVLNLARNRLEAAHLHDMFKNPTVTKLKHLDLSNNPLGVTGLAAVCYTAALKDLESLDLSGTRPTLQGFDFLAGSYFPKLKRLVLQRTEVGVKALRLLMKSDMINGLRELDLSHNRIDSRGTAVLLEQAGFDALDVLGLRHNDIGDTFAVRQRFGKRVRV